MRRDWTGWAVEITPTGLLREKAKYLRPYLLGRYAGPYQMTVPMTLGGYRTAVCNTRWEARALAKQSAHYTPRGDRKDCILYKRVRVVRVQVTVRVTKE